MNNEFPMDMTPEQYHRLHNDPEISRWMWSERLGYSRHYVGRTSDEKPRGLWARFKAYMNGPIYIPGVGTL